MLAYNDNINTATGELEKNQYEEISTPKILGLQHKSTRVITRKHEWKMFRPL